MIASLAHYAARCDQVCAQPVINAATLTRPRAMIVGPAQSVARSGRFCAQPMIKVLPGLAPTQLRPGTSVGRPLDLEHQGAVVGDLGLDEDVEAGDGFRI
jgi:hypothetical protein